MIYSEDAEISVISACLLDPKRVDECVEVLEPSDFYFPVMRDCWKWIVNQAATGGEIEIIGLAEHLETTQEESAYGGLAGLAEMVRGYVSGGTVVHYAKAVKDKSQRRKLQAVLGEIEGMALDIRQDFVSVVDTAQSRVAGLVGQNAETVGVFGDWMEGWINDIDGRFNGTINPYGLLYNIPELDNMTKGMHKEDLIVVAGESGMGKTVVAASIMDSVCLRQGEPVVMYQLEMNKGKVFNRVVGSYSGLKLDALKDPRNCMDDEGWAKLTAAAAKAKDSPLVIDDRPGLTPSQIRSSAKRWKQHFGKMGAIIIDHAGIVQPDDKSLPREQQVSEVSKSAKILAKELQCPVILLAQVNRANTIRKDKRPVMSDLRESASLEHNADTIIFIYREAKHNPECDDPGIAELIVAKQRDGEVGTVKVVCDLSRSQLKPLTAENISNYYREFPIFKSESKSEFEL